MNEQNETPNEQNTSQPPTPPPAPFGQHSVSSQQFSSPYQQNGPYQQQTPPPYGYQQVPPHGGPYQQSGFYQQQNNPYQQVPPQQAYYQQNPYQQQGYSYWQQGQYPPAQNKSKAWPWVLIVCLLLTFIGLSGCVGCIACTAILSENDTQYDDYYYDDDYYDYYDYYDDDDYYYDNNDLIFTFAEIESLFSGDGKGEVIDGKCSTGMYVVGKDIDPGLYFLEGSQTTEGTFYLFEEDTSDAYHIDAVVSFFGNYFAELEKGDIIIFSTPRDSVMYPVALATVEVADPIQSGLYRVGTDIPAGTYTVTYQAGAPSEATQEPGVFVMKDLDWDDDSVLEYYYLIEGGSHTVTLKDGQYVELFLATMVSA